MNQSGLLTVLADTEQYMAPESEYRVRTGNKRLRGVAATGDPSTVAKRHASPLRTSTHMLNAGLLAEVRQSPRSKKEEKVRGHVMSDLSASLSSCMKQRGELTVQIVKLTERLAESEAVTQQERVEREAVQTAKAQVEAAKAEVEKSLSAALLRSEQLTVSLTEAQRLRDQAVSECEQQRQGMRAKSAEIQAEVEAAVGKERERHEADLEREREAQLAERAAEREADVKEREREKAEQNEMLAELERDMVNMQTEAAEMKEKVLSLEAKETAAKERERVALQRLEEAK
ncbi:hypothetical protein KIPB_004126, partial [Kipferlia bialata]|eukprot:g4126.t1